MNPTWSFAHPFVLAALLLIPVYELVRRRIRRHDAIPFAPLQYWRGKRQGRLPSILLRIVEPVLLSVVILGLAGPHLTGDLDLIEGEGVDVLLVLDVSLSMLAEDFPPNRLEALRELSRDFISRSGSNRVGVVIFAGDAFVQVPLTTSHRVLLELLDAVTVHTIDQALSGGTAIGDALLVAGDHLERFRIEDRDQALVLITDGESNVGSDPVMAARYIKHQGVRFYAIGLGGEDPIEVIVDGETLGGDDPYLAYLDDAQLEGMAAAAEGSYFRATDVGSLEAIFAEIGRLEGAPLEVRSVNTRRYLTRYLALLALPLFALYLYLGGVVLRRPYR